ncbi:hypothetical protein [Zooshikella sp. RANM57]|uniref:hypothetical protein n=1 Tax=Zooshikella sp. RANM57 TaxID=3425863 RepID=UPI003D6E712C
MLSTKLFDSLEVDKNNNLKVLFDSFDDYYDPYFILISYIESTDLVFNLCSSWIRKNEDDLYGCDWFDVKENLMFICISCERDKVNEFVYELINGMKSITHISVFRHNCIGKPTETFKWTTQLLEETAQDSTNKSAVGINDFTDRENWPGIERYCE